MLFVRFDGQNIKNVGLLLFVSGRGARRNNNVSGAPPFCAISAYRRGLPSHDVRMSSD